MGGTASPQGQAAAAVTGASAVAMKTWRPPQAAIGTRADTRCRHSVLGETLAARGQMFTLFCYVHKVKYKLFRRHRCSKRGVKMPVGAVRCGQAAHSLCGFITRAQLGERLRSARHWDLDWGLLVPPTS